LTKQWYHFDHNEVEARISILAVDEEAARGFLRILLKGFREDGFELHSTTFNRDGSPVL